jgi:hypothetical protein
VTGAGESGSVADPAADDPAADDPAADDPAAAVPPVVAAADPVPVTARRGEPIDWVLVALITVLTGWTAIVAIAFLPVYLGPVPLPVSSLLGVGAMILAPRACYGLTGSMLAAVAPVVSWFGVSVWLVLSRNALINLPVTVYQGQWRVMVLLGLGSLAAAATVGLIWGDRLRDRIAAERGSARSGRGL